MNSLPLVSVIVPCYNISSKMDRFLISILNQTYSNLELLFVDDGSTDYTKEKIIKFSPKFEEKGMQVHYFYQDNKGLGGAINTGLKKVTGQYLIWPDPDDWLENDAVEKRVDFLEQHREFDVVTSNATIWNSKNMQSPVGKMVDPVDEKTVKTNQFKLLLHYDSIFCPGCHMVRMSAFDEVNPNRDIFEARRGQNFQMLLPLYYSKKRYYMDECLYNYVVYADSMSRGDDSFEKIMIRNQGLLEIITETLPRIDMPEAERERYMKDVLLEDAYKCLNLAIKYNNGKVYGKYFKIIGKLQGNTANLDKKKYITRHFSALWPAIFCLKRMFKHKN